MKSINIVLHKSADVDGGGILLEAVPDLLPALCELLEVLNPVGRMLFPNGSTDSRNGTISSPPGVVNASAEGAAAAEARKTMEYLKLLLSAPSETSWSDATVDIFKGNFLVRCMIVLGSFLIHTHLYIYIYIKMRMYKKRSHLILIPY